MMKNFGCVFFICFSGLLNLRGKEISYNPVFFAYVIVKEKEVLYVIDC